jgi:non-ribosomal peptide synthetase-like protein
MVVVICRVLPKARPPMDLPLGSLRAQVVALKLILVSMVSEKLEDASIQAAFFRWCGAQVGKDCILADQVVLPETLKLGDRCFFASHNVLTSVTVDQGRLQVPCETVFGSDVFLGNWNHVPEGLPDSSLCGMRTCLPTKPEQGASFFGSPPVTFQRPGSVEGSPPTCLAKFWHLFSSGFLDVFFWDCLNMLCLSSAFITCRTAMPIAHGVREGLPIIILLLKHIMVFAVFRLGAWIVVSLLFCNLIYSNRMPTSAPHYSCVVTRWYNATMARKAFPQPFHTAGTRWHAVMMRLYGAKVGRRFFSVNEQCLVDPPFATLGDDVTLDYDAQIWQHSFEDMSLKFRPNSVGDGTTLMQAAELANSDSGPNVTLSRGSVTWKGQMLEAGHIFHGAPAGYVDEDSIV